MKIEAPFIPSDEDNFDSNFCSKDDIINDQTKERLSQILLCNEYKTAFKNFLFFNVYDDNNLKNNFVNPHKNYEEKKDYDSYNNINGKENNAKQSNGRNTQKSKTLKIPQLSAEAQEINKFNLFTPKSSKMNIKLNGF